MGKYQRKKIWWTSFTVNGIAYRQSLRTKKKAEAVKKEREVIARASAGMIEIQRAAPKKLFAAIDAYTEHKRLRWTKPRTELGPISWTV